MHHPPLAGALHADPPYAARVRQCRTTTSHCRLDAGLTSRRQRPVHADPRAAWLLVTWSATVVQA